MHIGLIGGIGPAATDFYYRGLIERHAKAGTTLDLTIAHADAPQMTRNLAAKDAKAQAEIFVRLVRRLEEAGAAAAAITSMGGHFCVDELIAVSPLPIVNAIPEVDAALGRRGLKKVGVLGTRNVMESGLYGGIKSVEIVRPDGDDLARVHQDYVDMAIPGRVTNAQRRTFFEIGEKLCRSRGAEAIMLGGTDLFLAFTGQDAPFPIVDCADIHVDAIYRRSVDAA
jgi:aspartate racemase